MGQRFFDINAKGHVVVRPTRTLGHEVDLFDVVNGMRERGLNTPVLLHFSDLLERRMRDMREAFTNAITENNYKGSYLGVYPIKVNQQRRVVEEIRRYGVELGFGLEVGSKPELLAVMGLTTDSPDRLIICNGFKEEKYIEFVTLAAKLGRNIVPVIENMGELKLIVEYADRLGVRPKIGVRMNLATPGAGRWRHSSGVKAKFGLSDRSFGNFGLFEGAGHGGLPAIAPLPHGFADSRHSSGQFWCERTCTHLCRTCEVGRGPEIS